MTPPVAIESNQEIVVLIVDDEPSVRISCASYLQSEGFITIEAGDGEQALQLLAKTPRVDLVITDVVMPRVGGLKLVEEIRMIHKNLPIILMTGYTADQVGMDIDADKNNVIFLLKPFSYGELVGHMRRLLAGRD